MKRKKKWNPAKAKRKLDRLFSQLILARDERVCQWCGAASTPDKKVHVDNSHVIPREYLGLRWDPSNSVALCFGCHKRRGKSWHGSPLEAVTWLRGHLGNEKCNLLLSKAWAPFDFNEISAHEIERELKERLASINVIHA